MTTDRSGTVASRELIALQAAAARLQVELSAGQAGQLVHYLDLLERWNAVYNLTSVRTRAGMLKAHLLDCLSVIEPLERVVADWNGPRRLLDVGSGGGLPGVVIATLFPDWLVVCCDSVGKKSAFVQQVALELKLANLRSVHMRVEALSGEAFGVIAARAFSTLAELVQATRAHLAAGGFYLAMKAKPPHAEIAGLPADVEVFHLEPLARVDSETERCIVWMRLRPPPAPC